MSARTRRLPARVLVAAFCFSVGAWSQAWAQAPQRQSVGAAKEPGRTHSFEVSFGAGLQTPDNVGTAAATMTTNAPGGGATTFFSNSITRRTAPAFRARIGYRLTRVLSLEGGFLVSPGKVEDRVSGDAEQAAPITIAGESMTQYFVDASIIAHLSRLAFAGGAGVPFLEAGGGYLRQMHETNVAFDTGQIYHFGGGATYMFRKRPTGRVTGMGLRADAQLYIRHKGFSTATSSQGVFASIGAALVVAF